MDCVETLLGTPLLLGSLALMQPPAFIQDSQPQITWQGQVLDPSNNPMTGVQVIAEHANHQIATTADNLGRFRIVWDRDYQWSGCIYALDFSGKLASPQLLFEDCRDVENILIQMAPGETLRLQAVEYNTELPIPNLSVLFDYGVSVSIGTTDAAGKAELRYLSTETQPGPAEFLDSKDKWEQLFGLHLIRVFLVPDQGYGAPHWLPEIERLPTGENVVKLSVFKFPDQVDVMFVDDSTGTAVNAQVYRVGEDNIHRTPFVENLVHVSAGGSTVSLSGMPQITDRYLTYCALARGYRPMTISIWEDRKEPLAIRLKPCVQPEVAVDLQGAQVVADVYWGGLADYHVQMPDGETILDSGFSIWGKVTSSATAAIFLPIDVEYPLVSLSVIGPQGTRRDFGLLARERLGSSPWRFNLSPPTRLLLVRGRNLSGDRVEALTVGLRALAEQSTDLGIAARYGDQYRLSPRRGFDAIGILDGEGEWLAEVIVAKAFRCAIWPAGQEGQVGIINEIPGTVQLGDILLDVTVAN